MKVQGKKKEKSAAIVGIVIVVAVMALAALGTGRTSAQWKTGNPVFEAVGTVVSKNYQELMPVGPKGQEQVYIKIVFRTDDKTTFVIPFRPRDMEAIPESIAPKEARTVIESFGGGWTMCSSNGCTTDSRPPSSKETKYPSSPGFVAHGTLRYHNCEGYLYCFDSFTETEAPKSSSELTTEKKHK